MLAGMYLKVNGKAQGAIRGSVVQDNHDGKIHIHAFKHDYDMPAKLQEGMTPGGNARGVLTLTKEMDQSSPQFLQALGKRETLTDFELEIYRPTLEGTGGTKLEFTLKLQGVLVVHIAQYSRKPHDEGSDGVLGHMEDISFAYQGFQMEHKLSGVSGDASWTDG
ncbi:hcp protein [Burkholderia ubonensis]|uniref:type VI secretion system tube protein TssD n=1 Tax=Burkholderia ubonensis TaxID=101571 RepID=UPI000754EFDD|nr:type VI secretion system tube protein TssD [Burkholderia ubonensis]KWC39195.1 hcp protein [Burkholderia ubonensis]KWC40150.1 hcp protein [Burkholderia ubonensis]